MFYYLTKRILLIVIWEYVKFEPSYSNKNYEMQKGLAGWLYNQQNINQMLKWSFKFSKNIVLLKVSKIKSDCM